MDTTARRGVGGPKRRLGLILAGLGATLFIYGLRRWLTILGSADVNLYTLGAIVGAFPPVGYLAGVRARIERQAGRVRSRIDGMGAVYLGIYSGVILSNAVEELVFRRFGTYHIYDAHNLFPFEILVLGAAALIPLAIGVYTGLAVAKRRAPNA